MPFQLVNDSTTEAMAGNQTSQHEQRAGTTSMRTTTSRSQPAELVDPAGSGGAARAVRRRSGAVGPRARRRSSGQLVKMVFFCFSMLLRRPSMSFGVLDEALQRRDHHGRREVGAGVAVEELRDVLRRPDEFGRLLLQRGVADCVRLVVGRR